MNTQLRAPFLALALCLLSGNHLHAEVYKSINQDGNVVYSDTPTDGAEKIIPPEISTIDAQKAPETLEPADDKASEEEKAGPTSYTMFSIQQPQDEMTIWDNSGNISVYLKLEPALDVEYGHRIWVYLDGKPVVKNRENLVQPLTGVNRGTHKIRAAIRSGNKTIKSTRTITVYMKQTSKLN